MDMRNQNPSAIRYIKLGPGGEWAAEALENATLLLGYREIAHQLCLESNWVGARNRLIEIGWSPSTATTGANQVRDFYELDDSALWITISNGRLWWAFAEKDVLLCPERGPAHPSRYRKMVGGWKCESLNGQALTTQNLSSALTKTAGYRMAICKINQEAYLLRRIRGDSDPLQTEALKLHGELLKVTLKMIRQLHWKEFEVLVDLIFARNGWQRGSMLGRSLPDADLVLDQPSTNETAWIQVKSRANQAQFDDYLERFRANGSCDRFFFVCHSQAGSISAPEEDRIHFWAGEILAETALQSGLYRWLMDRTV